MDRAESSLYDRQLRAWGHNAQRRMKETVVILQNRSIIMEELAKNCILCGFCAVVLVGSPGGLEIDFGAINRFCKVIEVRDIKEAGSQIISCLQGTIPLLPEKHVITITDAISRPYDRGGYTPSAAPCLPNILSLTLDWDSNNEHEAVLQPSADKHCSVHREPLTLPEQFIVGDLLSYAVHSISTGDAAFAGYSIDIQQMSARFVK